MAICESTDFIYPLQADVFNAIVEQGGYGNITKQWILDRTIACNLTIGGAALKEEVTPNVAITKDMILIGRCKTDIRISSQEARNSVLNVIVSNIRDAAGNHIYKETAGSRSGKSTIFEIATIEPVVGPFGSVDFYKLVLRRSENQAVNL